ncbi:MAG: cupin domain-containing protein [SAR324 cluster bacterium]|nr:cupin domain-containing protein [SAR324 cluster bacterium]
MIVIRNSDYPPIDPAEALNRMHFDGMNTRLIVAAKGCVIPRHGHERSEEVYVLSGRVRLNEDILEAGDLMRTEAGEFHEAEALEDSRFLVMNTIDPQ